MTERITQTESDGAPTETRRRRETKERLLAAALEVFAETGVGAASIEQISEVAGYTRGAFYSNFSSKEDLLFALLAQEQDSALYQAEAALSAAIGQHIPETMEALDTVVVTSLATLPECGRTWLLIRREVQITALRDADVARKYAASESAMFERVAQLLDETLAHVGRKSLISSLDLARVTVGVFDSSEQERLLGDPSSAPATGLFSRTLRTLLDRLTEPAE
jgi:AcrR family transcriptional regulator